MTIILSYIHVWLKDGDHNNSHIKILKKSVEKKTAYIS